MSFGENLVSGKTFFEEKKLGNNWTLRQKFLGKLKFLGKKFMLGKNSISC